LLAEELVLRKTMSLRQQRPIRSTVYSALLTEGS